MAKVEEVRDGYLADLPEELRTKLMDIHKIIVTKTREEFNLSKYDSINKTGWAQTWLEEFLAEPSDKNHIGSVRVYKKGKRHKCMIQITAHIDNHRNSDDEELFHGMIRNVFVAIRSKVRRKFDVRIECESEHGEPFEGMDVWTKSKTAKEIWDLFEDKKTKNVVPMKESYELILPEFTDLPHGLQTNIMESVAYINSVLPMPDQPFNFVETALRVDTNGYSGSITLSPFIEATDTVSAAYENMEQQFAESNPCKQLALECDDNDVQFEMVLEPAYAEQLCHYLEKSFMSESVPVQANSALPKTVKDVCESRGFKEIREIKKPEKISNEKKKEDESYKQIKPETEMTVNKAKNFLDDLFNNMNESVEFNPYTESVEEESKAAKAQLHLLGKQLINNCKKPDYKITQYTVDIYANIITKNLLDSWGAGYRNFSIVLDSYQSFYTVEFKIPKISHDFISRFIEGRENINGFLHRNQEIKMKISPRIFHTMKNPDNLYNFFRAAVRYYTDGVQKYSERLAAEYMRLPREMKNLICTSKLSSLVVAPIQMLFMFSDVNISDTKIFTINKEQMDKVIKFIKNIYTNYAAPDKEKKTIVEDLNNMIQSFNESFDDVQFSSLGSDVIRFFEGTYNDDLNKLKERFYDEQVDRDWLMNKDTYAVQYYKEAFGVKKLKKIPRDTVAYITIETESIKDANDKMMIASYCLSKLELVEWYIELIDSQSQKYIVPHSRPYLVTMRTDLLGCYKKIMNTPIPKADKPIIDVKYPTGYEG